MARRARSSMVWLPALLTVALLGTVGCSGGGDRASSSSGTSGGGVEAEADAGAGGDAASRDLCAELTAEEVAAVAGRQIAFARPLPPDLRVSRGSELPGCVYEDSGGLAITQIEMVSATRWDEVMADATLGLEPLPGVADEAFVRLDAGGVGRVLNIYLRDGEDHWEIGVLRGLSRDDAAALARLLTGR
ncbi:MAG: hypothetical protein WHS89_08100 [Acidimicrobiales bacterium]